MYAIDSVLSINTDPQPNPNKTGQYAGSVQIGKRTSGTHFSEYLESLIQQANAITASKQTEHHELGILMGYYLPVQLMHMTGMKFAVKDHESN